MKRKTWTTNDRLKSLPKYAIIVVLMYLSRPLTSLFGRARCALCYGNDNARSAWRCGTNAVRSLTIYPRAPYFPALPPNRAVNGDEAADVPKHRSKRPRMLIKALKSPCKPNGFRDTYMKQSHLALPVPKYHEDRVQKFDVFRHVIHPKGVPHKRVFLCVKKRVRPVACKCCYNEGH